MSTKTPIHGFIKPETTEFYDVAVQNSNWDMAETEFLKRVSRTTAPITFYVRIDGNDNNDGSANDAAHAFRTIQHAIDVLPKYLAHDVWIYVAAGTYNEDISIRGFYGEGLLRIRGDLTNFINYKVNKFDVYQSVAYVGIQGFDILTTSDHSIRANRCAYVEVTNNRIAGLSKGFYGVFSINGANVRVATCTISNKGAALCAMGGTLFSLENTGNGNDIGLLVAYGGHLSKYSMQPIGIAQETLQSGGIITTDDKGVSVWGGWKRYNSLATFGLVGSTVTIASLHGAMSDQSDIVFSLSGANALGLPNSYWQITVSRSAYNLTRITAVGCVGTTHTGQIWEGTYNSDVGFSGWVSNGTQVVDVIYYVRTDGNDSNDGLENTSMRAFRTIAGAIKTIPRTVNGYITIRIADGIYNERIALFGFTGSGTILIQGNTSAAGNVQITDILTVGCTPAILIGGVKPTKAVGTAVEVYRSTCVGLSNIEITTVVAGVGIYAEFSKVRASGCLISNRINNAAIQAHMHGEILVENCSGSNNATGIFATYGGKIAKAGTVPTGMTPESTLYGGIITGDPYTLTIAGGYAAGWSNAIFAHKTLGNVVTVTINLYKSSDINIQEVIYTLPVGYRPTVTRSVATFAHSEGVGIVVGNQTMVEIQPNGTVLVTPSGTMAGARRLWNVTVTYIAG